MIFFVVIMCILLAVHKCSGIAADGAVDCTPEEEIQKQMLIKLVNNVQTCGKINNRFILLYSTCSVLTI